MSNVSTSGFIDNLCAEAEKNNQIPKELFEKYDVKRGLRNADGTGVMVGLTRIGSVKGYVISDGEKTAVDGKLIYRGYDMMTLIEGYERENRFGFEEVVFLLLFGFLPTKAQYDEFRQVLGRHMALPAGFTEDMILKSPSNDVMNKLARSVLVLYSYDDESENNELSNLLHQSIRLVGSFPTIVAHAYAVKRHYFNNDSLYLHRPDENLSIAENFLRGIRPDKKYTDEEAKLLDLCLVIHAEHGGGNNSAFTCRSVSSTGSDTYSAIAAAVGSLKGPKHGGANSEVMAMFDEIKANVKNWSSDDEVYSYLERIIRKEAGDGSGLIYGMGHAVYTISDPRALILKANAKRLAANTPIAEEFELMERIERLAPEVYAASGRSKDLCANVDMYSGLVYKMLDIDPGLFTPIFAVARIPGWCAHRIEEVTTANKIMRPAYKALGDTHKYLPMDQR